MAHLQTQEAEITDMKRDLKIARQGRGILKRP